MQSSNRWRHHQLPAHRAAPVGLPGRVHGHRAVPALASDVGETCVAACVERVVVLEVCGFVERNKSEKRTKKKGNKKKKVKRRVARGLRGSRTVKDFLRPM